MKYLPSIFTTVFSGKMGKQNVRLLLRYIFVLALLISFYSIIFHYLMAAEGQKHSWITGFYWVLVVMSTLGFGDITFTSDVGRLFSIIVLASGVIFLLILLPFIFIKFFFAPWMDAQAKSRAPRELPPDTTGHVIITNYDAVTTSLIEKLTSYKQNYVVIVDNLHRTLELYDLGVYVALGSIDDPQTYKRLQVQNAALVVATNSDQVNTNVTFTVREMSERVPIFVTADSPHSVDILTMAGSSHVLLLYDMIGKSLASLTIAGDCKSNVIGRYEDLLIIAQAPVIRTPLEGKTIMESDLRKALRVFPWWVFGKEVSLPFQDRIQLSTAQAFLFLLVRPRRWMLMTRYIHFTTYVK